MSARRFHTPAPTGNGFSQKMSKFLTRWQMCLAGLRAVSRTTEKKAARLGRRSGPKWQALLREDSSKTGQISDAMAEIEQEIATIPARSVADVRLRLWLHAWTQAAHYDVTLTDQIAYARDGDLDRCLLLSALRDLERLSGAA